MSEAAMKAKAEAAARANNPHASGKKYDEAEAML
jgi:hypothetical protein